MTHLLNRRLLLAGAAATVSTPAYAQLSTGWSSSAPADVALELDAIQQLDNLTGEMLWKRLMSSLRLTGRLSYACNARLLIGRFGSGMLHDHFVSKTFFYRGPMGFDETLMAPASFFTNDMIIRKPKSVAGTMTHGPMAAQAFKVRSLIESRLKTYYAQKHIEAAMPNGYLFLSIAENSGFGCRTLNLPAWRG